MAWTARYFFDFRKTTVYCCICGGLPAFVNSAAVARPLMKGDPTTLRCRTYRMCMCVSCNLRMSMCRVGAVHFVVLFDRRLLSLRDTEDIGLFFPPRQPSLGFVACCHSVISRVDCSQLLLLSLSVFLKCLRFLVVLLPCAPRAGPITSCP